MHFTKLRTGLNESQNGHKSPDVAVRHQLTIGTLYSGAGAFGVGMRLANARSRYVEFRQQWNVDHDSDAVMTHWENMRWSRDCAVGMSMVRKDVRDVDFGNDGPHSRDVPRVDGVIIGPARDAAGHELCVIGQNAISQLRPKFFVAFGEPGHGSERALIRASMLAGDMQRRGKSHHVAGSDEFVSRVHADSESQRAYPDAHGDRAIEFLQRRGYSMMRYLCDASNFGTPHKQAVDLWIGLHDSLAIPIPSVPDWTSAISKVTAGDAISDIDPDASNHELHWERPSGDCDIYLASDRLAPNLRSMRGVHWDGRYITNRELARLYGFDDGYEFHGRIASVRRQIALSIPPLLAAAVLAAVAGDLERASAAGRSISVDDGAERSNNN